MTEHVLGEVNRNTLWHGRRGAVGQRLLIRFWVTQDIL